MAICSTCGCEVPAGTVFCPSCGASVGKAKKGGAGKVIGIIVAIVAVAAIGVGAFFFLSGSSSSPEGMIKGLAKAMNKRGLSEKTMYAIAMNDYAMDAELDGMKAMIEAGIDDDYDSIKEAIEEEFGDLYEELDDEFGDDWKITVDVKSTKDIKKKDDKFERVEDRWDSFVESLENMAEWYEDYGDDDYEDLAEVYEKYAKKYNKYKVTEVKEVKAKLTIKGDDDKDSETVTMLFGKINGKWVCMDGGPDFF